MPTHSPKALLKQAKKDHAPIIDGDEAVFIWEGKSAPFLIGDFNGWNQDPDKIITLQKAAPGIWIHRLKLPADAYVEYAYIRIPHKHSTRAVDPLNNKSVDNGFGGTNNYFSMPEYQHSPLTHKHPDVLRGVVTKHVIDKPWLVGKKRNVWLYQPPVDKPSPLLVVYDGNDFRKRARITNIVDNLIHQKRIKPIALAMVKNGGEMRFMEYNCAETTLLGVYSEVLPLAKAHLNIVNIKKHPGAYGIAGASMGGLMALYTGMRMPHIFGHIISHSGAFDPFHDDVPPLYETLLETFTTPPPLKIWMDVGRMEWLYASNRALHQKLVDKGWDVTYREVQSGHNYTAWRNLLPDALTTLYGVEGS